MKSIQKLYPSDLQITSSTYTEKPNYLQLVTESYHQEQYNHESPKKRNIKTLSKPKTERNKKKSSNSTHISVELTNEAGKIIMLEIPRQNHPRELDRIPHHEAVLLSPPRNYPIQRRIVRQIVRLRQKRRDRRLVQRFQRLRRAQRAPGAGSELELRPRGIEADDRRRERRRAGRRACREDLSLGAEAVVAAEERVLYVVSTHYLFIQLFFFKDFSSGAGIMEGGDNFFFFFSLEMKMYWCIYRYWGT